MVLQAVADPGGGDEHLDAVLAQVAGRADARQQQQLRAVDRPAAQEHLAPGPDLTLAAVAQIPHPDGPPPSISTRVTSASVSTVRLPRSSAGRR
jgi:hypothetical protein